MGCADLKTQLFKIEIAQRELYRPDIARGCTLFSVGLFVF